RPRSSPLGPPPTTRASAVPTDRVTAVVPTLDRYPWLDTVLADLAAQTVALHQVIVVDQTPAARRRAVDRADLPLEVLTQDRPGQSTARNAALARATGELVLFVDDDDELESDLVERHLQVIERMGVDVSCGVAHEPGDADPDPEFTRFRVADVFPTNNTMARRSVLDDTGWFDEAFDHGVRADHDLGTRLYLDGARMVLSPDIDVLHHRAPVGGLRVSDSRRVTAASSRRSLFARQPVAATEIYLWRRHHPDGVRPAIALRLFGNLRGDGSLLRRMVRAAIQVVLLPAAARQAKQAGAEAEQLASAHPTIPRPRDRAAS
ncbi:MAG: glycosyltransferase family A protein, partial [Actinomycetota bacterium]